jgi:hypothetical protein
MVFEEYLNKREVKVTFNIFDILFIIVAIILIVLGIFIANSNVKLVRNSIETTATLEKLNESNKYILKYRLENGNSVESYSLYNDVLHFFKKYDNITVLYEKDKPTKAIVKSFVSIYGIGFFSCFIGIILILVMLIKFFKVKFLNR